MPLVRTAVLMAAMTALFIGVGWMIGGSGGAAVAFIAAAAMNGWAWWNSDRMVLRQQGARRIAPGDAGGLHALVAGLARDAGMPVPAVWIIDTPQPNAFATGRNPENAAVAVTTGLLKSLSRDEIAGVVAHELAHIRNRDTLIMTITATFAGAIAMLANIAMFFGGRRDGPMGFLGVLAMALVAPMAAGLVQMAISRTREYEADRIGAEIAGGPRGLAAALARIDRIARGTLNAQAERHPASAHMFIVNPLHAHRHDNLFATHPATENRIRALLALEEGIGPETAPRARGPWG